MHVKRTIFSAIVTSLILTLGTIGVANAYECQYDARPTRQFNVRYGSLSPQWTNVMDSARSYWNASGAGTSIGTTPGSSAVMEAGNYNTNWYGLYTWNPAIGSFNIKINGQLLSSNAPSDQFWTWAKSTATHELGHALRLTDKNQVSFLTLMDWARNRSQVFRPQSYDVANVRYCY